MYKLQQVAIVCALFIVCLKVLMFSDNLKRWKVKFSIRDHKKINGTFLNLLKVLAILK